MKENYYLPSIAVLSMLCVFLLSSSSLVSQNLVPNPSFEEISECPNNPFQISRCVGWEPWRNTADYFNSCATEATYGELLINVPTNGFGYQVPATGEAYMGMYLFSDELNFPFQEASEIIGCELTSPLEIGELYYLSMQVSWTVEGFKFSSEVATNGIGLQFFTQNFGYDLDPVEQNNFAHLYSQSIIQDSVGWTTISGSFIADQAYTHVGVGNFFDGYNLEYINTISPMLGSGAYYYVDDICVSKDPDCEVSLSEEKIEYTCKEPYVLHDQITIDLSCDVGVKYVSLLSTTGAQLWSVSTNESEIHFNSSEVPTGVYLIRVVTESGVRSYRKVIG